MMHNWTQEMGASVLLVIDDDPAIREVLSHALKRSGHRVHTAADGLAGVRLARTVRPDLILADIILPDIDGIEAGKRIKADRPMGHVPIVAMTGAATPEMCRRVREAGLLGPLLKPFRLYDLNRQIIQWLISPNNLPL